MQGAVRVGDTKRQLRGPDPFLADKPTLYTRNSKVRGRMVRDGEGVKTQLKDTGQEGQVRDPLSRTGQEGGTWVGFLLLVQVS